MGKSLVIVESPSKVKTISKYLGKDYVVKSSRGHVRDLPTSGNLDKTLKPQPIPKNLNAADKAKAREARLRADRIYRMGVNPDKNWIANWAITVGKDNVVRDLKSAADRADSVYLATDLDREGEAIAWHLQELIGGDPERFHRVVFNEITKAAVDSAFANPGKIDLARVDAFKTRRYLDRVVGYELSPLLWDKIARGLSAGRVQSVAVRLVVEKEREIRAFNVEEYWDLFADLVQSADQSDPSGSHRFKVVRFKGEDFSPSTESEAAEALEALRNCEFVVAKHERRPTGSRPQGPFTTSTLQQVASTRLGFRVRRTMSTAQSLYERGLITYMRTDSMHLSNDAVESVRKFIGQQYASRYLPESQRTYASKAKSAQEAHEGIRPTSVLARPGDTEFRNADERRLYDLIWRRFVACQMTNSQYESVTTTVSAGDYELVIRGRVVLFDGFTKVWQAPARKDEDQVLPPYVEGQSLQLEELEKKQHFTKPPARFREASLVKELEERGVGRPSTYESIISTIQDRGYVTLRDRKFYAEPIGELVTEKLMESFSDLLDYEFTSKMETEELDGIADGSKNWQKVLDDFYRSFSKNLKTANKSMERKLPTKTSIKCSECGRNMVIRIGSTGLFLGCDGYFESPKNRCRNTMDLTDVESSLQEADDEAEAKELRLKKKCSDCGTIMSAYLIDETRKIHICQDQGCMGYELETGKFEIPGYDGPEIECDKCSSPMQRLQGRFGAFYSCTSDTCSNTRKILRNGQVAPPRADPIPMPELRCEDLDDHYVLRDGASGIFLAASKFPKNRKTRAPLVKELRPYANKLDPKFMYLLTAPAEDPAGRDTSVRFSRKRQQHYVRAEGKGKPWAAFFEKGNWVEQSGASTRRKTTRAK